MRSILQRFSMHIGQSVVGGFYIKYNALLF
jgi:hypothetical protein